MIWFTSDLHLGHQSIIRHQYRPFNSIKQMDNHLIAQINDRVSWTDELWVLGDFSHRVPASGVHAYRERINCKTIHLVRGNHDMEFTQGQSPFQEELSYTDSLRTPPPDRRRLVLFHYPIVDWNGANEGAIHLHGHIHARAAYNEDNRRNGLLRYDVGVDANDYAPVSLDHILTFFSGVEPRPIHHV